jgi:hypothetical protein
VGQGSAPPFSPGSAAVGQGSAPPFRPGSQPPVTPPFVSGSPSSATQPFNAGAPSTQPFNSGTPATQPFNAGSSATQPFNSGASAPATQPFAAQPYGSGSSVSSAEDAPHPYRDASGNPYGVGGAAATREPFGGFSAPGAQRTAPSDSRGSSVPQQRGDAPGLGSDGYPSPDATMPVPVGFPPADATMPVYNYGSIDSTMPVSTNPVENSGSLTGHILAQGWHDEATDRRRSNMKVAIAMLVVLGLLVTVSLVFLFTAGDAFTNMVKGVFK